MSSAPAYAFCDVCRANHQDGPGHKFSGRHQRAFGAWLDRQRARVRPLRDALRRGGRDRGGAAAAGAAPFWCAFCKQEIRATGSDAEWAEALEHLSSPDHERAVKRAIFDNGGRVADLKDAFLVSQPAVHEYRFRCERARQRQSVCPTSIASAAGIGPTTRPDPAPATPSVADLGPHATGLPPRAEASKAAAPAGAMLAVVETRGDAAPAEAPDTRPASVSADVALALRTAHGAASSLFLPTAPPPPEHDPQWRRLQLCMRAGGRAAGDWDLSRMRQVTASEGFALLPPSWRRAVRRLEEREERYPKRLRMSTDLRAMAIALRPHVEALRAARRAASGAQTAVPAGVAARFMPEFARTATAGTRAASLREFRREQAQAARLQGQVQAARAKLAAAEALDSGPVPGAAALLPTGVVGDASSRAGAGPSAPLVSVAQALALTGGADVRPYQRKRRRSGQDPAPS